MMKEFLYIVIAAILICSIESLIIPFFKGLFGVKELVEGQIVTTCTNEKGIVRVVLKSRDMVVIDVITGGTQICSYKETLKIN